MKVRIKYFTFPYDLIDKNSGIVKLQPNVSELNRLLDGLDLDKYSIDLEPVVNIRYIDNRTFILYNGEPANFEHIYMPNESKESIVNGFSLASNAAGILTEVQFHEYIKDIINIEDAQPILDYTNRLETILQQNGFVVDAEKDERTTYVKDRIFITLFWDGAMILPSSETGLSHCVSMQIEIIPYPVYGKSDILYFGKRPSSDKELEEIFKHAGIEESFDKKII